VRRARRWPCRSGCIELDRGSPEFGETPPHQLSWRHSQHRVFSPSARALGDTPRAEVLRRQPFGAGGSVLAALPSTLRPRRRPRARTRQRDAAWLVTHESRTCLARPTRSRCWGLPARIIASRRPASVFRQSSEPRREPRARLERHDRADVTRAQRALRSRATVGSTRRPHLVQRAARLLLLPEQLRSQLDGRAPPVASSPRFEHAVHSTLPNSRSTAPNPLLRPYPPAYAGLYSPVLSFFASRPRTAPGGAGRSSGTVGAVSPRIVASRNITTR